MTFDNINDRLQCWQSEYVFCICIKFPKKLLVKIMSISDLCVTKLNCFAAERTFRNKHDRRRTLASINFSSFPFNVVRSFALFISEMACWRCWQYRPYLSTNLCIGHIWWSIQRVPVALTGLTPFSYISNSSFMIWYKFFSSVFFWGILVQIK